MACRSMTASSFTGDLMPAPVIQLLQFLCFLAFFVTLVVLGAFLLQALLLLPVVIKKGRQKQ